ncbi:MAG: universal stress protein [Rhodobacteraceae bacterium]|nr:universal stress protein [Paracoccaceae bacterium]
MTIGTITVATDLSERSDRAVRRAADLARTYGASLTVLNIVDADLPDDLEEIMVAKTRERPQASSRRSIRAQRSKWMSARIAAILAPGIKLKPVNAIHAPYQGRLGAGVAAPLEAACMKDAEVAAASWRAALSLDDAVCGSVSIKNGSA